MDVGDYVEAHNATHGWRGVVVDYDHAEGFVTLDQVERFVEGEGSRRVPNPVTLIEAAYEWAPARFRPRLIEGGAY